MKLNHIKVHHYFWMVSLVLLILGALYRNPNDFFDINVGDTYYVIACMQIAVLLFVIYFLTGVGYWFVLNILRKPLIRYLTVIHCIFMFGWFLVYGSVVLYSRVIVTTPFPLFDNSQYSNFTLVILILLISFVAQPLYLLNLFIGIFRKRNFTIVLVGLTLGSTLISCGKEQPNSTEIYNQRANEFIFSAIKGRRLQLCT